MSLNNSSAVDRVICPFQAHGLSENSLLSALKCEAENSVHHVTHTKNMVHDQVPAPSCAQETPLSLRILCVRRSLNSVRVQQDQRPLVIKNAFLVLVLGFHVIGIDCRDKLRQSLFVLVHTCVPLHRSVQFD